MSRWTQIIDADVTWACGELPESRTPGEILDYIARERGRAYALQEIEASLVRIRGSEH